MNTITCRAKISGNCLDGHPAIEQFGEDLPMDEDGTYRPLMGTPGPDNNPQPIGDVDDGSIVCDPCYLELMPYTPGSYGLFDDLDRATALYKTDHGVKS